MRHPGARQKFLAGPLRFSLAGIFLIPFLCVPSEQQSSPPTIRVSAELVNLYVSVADRRGNLLSNLSGQNFRILDDGAEQPIVFFSTVEAPAQVLVMVETSPAVYLIHRQHLQAAYALFDGLAPQDLVALATYDNAPRLLLQLTADKQALWQGLNGVQYTLGMGELSFYDSVSAALDWLAPTHGKKSLLLLTTGLDTFPPARWDALVQKLRSSDVTIFCVALGGSLREYPRRGAKAADPASISDSVGDSAQMSFARADEALRQLAQISGGQAFFPASAKEFAGIYRQVAALLRHQYILGFAPAHDGRFHSIEVDVMSTSGSLLAGKNAKSGYRIYARSGYLAPPRSAETP